LHEAEKTLDEKVERVNILGVNICAIHMGQAIQAIEERIARQDPGYVCVTSVHGVLECVYDPSLRRIFNDSGLITPDGMGIVWTLRIMGQRQVSRVYGPDLMLAMCQRSQELGWRHYLYGGGPGIAEKLSSALQSRFPGLQIVGTCCPPFRPLTPDEDRCFIEQINAARPDIVWVGISTPKQERWMSTHLGVVKAPVLIGVGAAFDFLSGTKRQAPRWMQRSGLEWAFRLGCEPRRLWRRYIQFPYFGVLVLAQALGLKRFPLD
jgi:N-acetylglucosaminyldiphosphoundecaprenol N-acetyl-beta-D-mannosaminyltransferase